MKIKGWTITKDRAGHSVVLATLSKKLSKAQIRRIALAISRQLGKTVTVHPNPTLVHHGLTDRATWHVLGEDADGGKFPMADLYMGDLREARKITSHIADVLGYPMALVSFNVDLPSLEEHYRRADRVLSARAVKRRKNPAGDPRQGEVWTTTAGGRCKVLQVTPSRVQVLHMETGTREWIDKPEFFASYKPPRTRRNPKRRKIISRKITRAARRATHRAMTTGAFPGNAAQPIYYLERHRERSRRRGNPKRRRRELSVPEQHQLKIARQTLRMRPEFVRIMGGPTVEEAREIIRRLTGKEPNPSRTKTARKRRAAKSSGRKFYGRRYAKAERRGDTARRMYHKRDTEKRTMRNPRHFGQQMPSSGISAAISPGDRVTWVDRFGKERTGKAVMPSSHGGWVLNMGGAHGTPAVVDNANIVRVSKRKQSNPLKPGEQLSHKEITLIHQLYPHHLVMLDNIERRSGREFDVKVSGHYYADAPKEYRRAGDKFGAWLPLAFIASHNWTTAKIANMTDYPEMVRAGDWSGVRDSSTETIWQIFDYLRDPGAFRRAPQRNPRKNPVTTAQRLARLRRGPRPLSHPRKGESWQDPQGGVYHVVNYGAEVVTLRSGEGIEFPIFWSDMSQWRRVSKNPAGPRPGNDRNFAIATIRKALKQRSGKSWSVTGGTGTAWGWIHIDAPPKRRTWQHVLPPGMRDESENYVWVDSGKPGGYTGPPELKELASLLGLDYVHFQGVSIPASSDYREEYMDRAQGVEPHVIGTPYWDNPLPRWVDRRSIRSVARGRDGILVGCPSGAYHPRKRGKRKCSRPMRRVNPATELERAKRTSKMWNEFPATRVKRLRVPSRTIPKHLVQLGQLHTVVYRSNKYDGKYKLHEHRFKRPLPVLTSDPDGRTMHIVGGGYSITGDGIVN